MEKKAARPIRGGACAGANRELSGRVRRELERCIIDRPMQLYFRAK